MAKGNVHMAKIMIMSLARRAISQCAPVRNGTRPVFVLSLLFMLYSLSVPILHAQIPTRIIANPSFEEPDLNTCPNGAGSGVGYGQLPQDDVPGWLTSHSSITPPAGGGNAHSFTRIRHRSLSCGKTIFLVCRPKMACNLRSLMLKNNLVYIRRSVCKRVKPYRIPITIVHVKLTAKPAGRDSTVRLAFYSITAPMTSRSPVPGQIIAGRSQTPVRPGTSNTGSRH